MVGFRISLLLTSCAAGYAFVGFQTSSRIANTGSISMLNSRFLTPFKEQNGCKLQKTLHSRGFFRSEQKILNLPMNRAASRMIHVLASASADDSQMQPPVDTDSSWYGEIAPSSQESIAAQPSQAKVLPGRSKVVSFQEFPDKFNKTGLSTNGRSKTTEATPLQNDRHKQNKRRGNKLQLLKARDLAYRILEQREVGDGEDFIENLFERSISNKMAGDERGLCQELVSSSRLAKIDIAYKI